MRILIFRRGLLGDTIVAVAALKEIRKHYPTAHITYIAEQAEGQETNWPGRLLSQQGLVDQIIPFAGYNNPSKVRKISALFKLLPLFFKHWDICIHLDSFERTRTESHLSRFLLVKKRILSVQRPFLNRSLRKGENIVDELVHIVSQLCIPLPKPLAGDITLRISEPDQRSVTQYI